ncbi:MAG: hypothetical protein WCT04_06155 [Planctomycetota bacterium]
MSTKTNTTIIIIVLACTASVLIPALARADDPPEVALGERLFLETRFAQYFFANCNGDVNATLAVGDPVMSTLSTPAGSIPGPFAGKSMNCRQCHVVDDAKSTGGGGSRSYSDFARRSPIPAREDGRTQTPRNSPSLVNASLTRPAKTGFFLHFDGEFTSLRDLVNGTYTGRNYGWLPNESAAAIHHIATVIRQDNGKGDLAKAFGGAYRFVLKGEGNQIPEAFRIPAHLRIDVMKATDEQVVRAATTFVAIYMNQLLFSQDDNGIFNGSPYDLFLKKNSLPPSPGKHETALAYGRRLLARINALNTPKFVTPADGSLQLHAQSFQFGATELAGLKLFLSEPAFTPSGSAGNCIACHAPPAFTDFRFHNTGATQEEYDAIHSDGSFKALTIPSHTQRLMNTHEFLPPNASDPTALGRFISVPIVNDPVRVDLGMWNVIGNPNTPKPQRALIQMLTRPGEKKPKLDTLVDRSIAHFKTPGLRDLGHSGPYLHTGRMNTLEDVVQFYVKFSALSRADAVRNPDPDISKIQLEDSDVDALAKFLKSLNEDYE